MVTNAAKVAKTGKTNPNISDHVHNEVTKVDAFWSFIAVSKWRCFKELKLLSHLSASSTNLSQANTTFESDFAQGDPAGSD